MINPLIAALDDGLARAGQGCILRRIVGTVPSASNYDVTVQAVVRSFSPEELVGGIAMTDSQVIMSPTEIAAAGWPGDGEVPSDAVPDPSLPRRNDKLVIAGRVRNIDVVRPFYVAGALVRIELVVKG